MGFGTELGSQSTYSNVVGTGERAVVNGHHDTVVFQTMLDKFIDTYVLCKNCHLPEIDLVVKKSWISAKCAACGWAGDLDNNHKLARFISTYPPDKNGLNIQGSNGGGGGGKVDKPQRRLAKPGKLANEEEPGGSNNEGSGSNDEPGKKNKETKNNKDKKDALAKKDKKE